MLSPFAAVQVPDLLRHLASDCLLKVLGDRHLAGSALVACVQAAVLRLHCFQEVGVRLREVVAELL